MERVRHFFTFCLTPTLETDPMLFNYNRGCHYNNEFPICIWFQIQIDNGGQRRLNFSLAVFTCCCQNKSSFQSKLSISQIIYLLSGSNQLTDFATSDHVNIVKNTITQVDCFSELSPSLALLYFIYLVHLQFYNQLTLAKYFILLLFCVCMYYIMMTLYHDSLWPVRQILVSPLFILKILTQMEGK